ncbi:hypothetical protein F5883DRAFT_623149 [Diaporthe sp. PMI_573]|nr:hypothetical protein F5883DRAFT_623149 [Diaporthaceae sp. PMI_573]
MPTTGSCHFFDPWRRVTLSTVSARPPMIAGNDNLEGAADVWSSVVYAEPVDKCGCCATPTVVRQEIDAIAVQVFRFTAWLPQEPDTANDRCSEDNKNVFRREHKPAIYLLDFY